MKRLAVILAITAVASIALAQQPGSPSVVQPTTEQKAQLKALAQQWDQKAHEADAAKDKYMIALLATMAELGLKPSETSVSWNEKGEPVFSRVEAAKVPPSQPKPKPEVKP